MKKIILAFVAVALCVAPAFASGHHPGKPRKGEIAAGIAGGIVGALLGRPEPPPPAPVVVAPAPVVVQQPAVVTPAPVVVQQPAVVAPAPVVAAPAVVTPAPAVVAPAPVVVAPTTYTYGVYNGMNCVTYDGYYWYNGVWVWGGIGPRRPLPPWRPNFGPGHHPGRPMPGPGPHHHRR